MAASSSSQVLEEELKDAGNRLLTPPASTPELLNLLDEVELLLSRVEQAPSGQTKDALVPIMKGLIMPELLRHSENDVKVSIASCINEITRVTAPNTPYDDNQMQEVFELSLMALGNLSLASGRCYTKAVSILHNIAGVRSCLVMLDLEFDELIVEMFKLFFNTIRSDHPHSVFSDMENIMTLVIEETEEIPLEILIPLLSSVKKENQNVSPLSWKLGDDVLRKCAAKLEPYLPPAVQFMGIDLCDFAEIVFSICQDASGREHLASAGSSKPESVPKKRGRKPKKGLPNENGLELTKETGGKKTLPFSATGSSNSDGSQFKKSSKTKGKRNRNPKEEVSEMAVGVESHGEELVGCEIKVWWPLDRMFYEGAISSFDPIAKKHQILYADGEEEMLDLRTERWILLRKSNSTKLEQGNDLSSSDAVSDTKMDSADDSSLPSLSNEAETNNPLWNYVTRLEKISGGGGNVTWQCNFCKVIKKGSYTRVRGHLLNLPTAGIKPCEKVTSKDVATMQRLENEAKGRKKKRKLDSEDAISLPPSFNEVETDNPLWNYVTRLEKPSDGGGNVTWRCNFCKAIKKGSYTRVRGHFLNLPCSGVRPCEKVSSKDVETMQRLDDAARGRKR